MDISHDITYEYITRVRYHEDELGTVLKGHLLIEHVLDLMIKKGLKQPKAILNDHRTYSFSVKARILFEGGYIQPPIFKNIVRINRIRNELAHNLKIKKSKVDYRFSRDDKDFRGDVDIKKVVKKHNNPLFEQSIEIKDEE